MRINVLKNISEQQLVVKTTQGVIIELDPGQSVKHIDVANFDEMRGKVTAVFDLQEVNR